MKQVFTKNHNEEFKKYFWIKNKASKFEQKYIHKTEKYIKYVKWIPWIRMIWIWNSISMNAWNEASDIDLYIVTDLNRMWFVRIFVTLIFSLLWVRKNDTRHAWRFCLSFFSTLKWMDFSTFKLENDIYLYFWIIYFKPILDYGDTYKLFIESNSRWANFSEYKDIINNNKKFIKFMKPIYWNTYTSQKKETTKLSILNFIDNTLKKVFLPKTTKHFERLWKPFWIIINNNLLKFHNWDIREKIKEELV